MSNENEILEEARRRAIAGDGVIASLLTNIVGLEEKNAQLTRIVSEWESGVRKHRQEVWGYDG